MNPKIVSPRHSVLFIDKPFDLTSFRTAYHAARKFGLRKAGHTGTLDANVTGLLVVALDEATKGIPLLSGMDKSYVGTMRFLRSVPEEQLRAAAALFLGRIQQLPPEKSAVKRVLRERTIHDFIIGTVTDETAEFQVSAQAGTYVRTLLADLGKALNVPIEMAALRRVQVGPFSIEEAARLDEISAANLCPLENAFERLGVPQFRINRKQEDQLRHGVYVKCEAPIETTEYVSLISDDGIIAVLARLSEGLFKPKRIFAPLKN